MGEPVWEYRVRREYLGGRTPDHTVEYTHFGYEERAARVQWEKMRANFLTTEHREPTHDEDIVRLVFEARKIVKWNEIEDTTPMYARGEEDESSAPTS